MIQMIVKNRSLQKAEMNLIKDTAGIQVYRFRYVSQEKAVPEAISVSFFIPCLDIYSVWNAMIGEKRSLISDWRPNIPVCQSRFNSGAPIQTLISHEGNNRLTVSLADARTPISIKSGIVEDGGQIRTEIMFFTQKVAALQQYETFVYLDFRDIPYYEAIREAVERMRPKESEKGYLYPKTSRMPMYSTWYCFHQKIEEELLVRQCIKAKEMGMECIIVDDGWQTENEVGGYAFCGDWTPATTKFPDMKRFVERVHELDMKVMLWFSVPYVGKNARIYKEFEGMYLDNPDSEWNVLDPRFPKVREYLVRTYEDAVKNWGLDGLKMDFIDCFGMTEYSDQKSPLRDYDSVEDAVEALLSEIQTCLLELNPDILIEFRQNYMGPLITRYSNMLRVGDCAMDAIVNRTGVIDLRLLSTGNAIHSDMLIWNEKDTPENMAKQLIAVLCGVPQISVRMDQLSEQHARTLKFYLSFWIKYSKVLMEGELIPHNPEICYSRVEAIGEETCICICYSVNDFSLKENTTIAVNGTGRAEMVMVTQNDAAIEYEIFNCQGDLIEKKTSVVKEGAFLLPVPISGMVVVKSEVQK
ncbi:MAG: alpha-galactosidase [Lachnospiraceae bacterium]|nr:alpha-galactosidase [Lachnospiraceae bacterium]